MNAIKTGGNVRVIATVPVKASGAYDVVFGHGLLAEAGARVRAALLEADDAVLLVTDRHVDATYGDLVVSSLVEVGFDVERVVLQPGETTKCLASYGELLEAAACAGLTRKSTVVALGGGVMGDLAGFAAATYMRGCHLVQLATSLLAMVDSSVGGKTAIDLGQGKNLAGAFHQPDLVLCDIDCLATLPDLYLCDGTGEVMKYGVMADPELFGWLEGPLAGQEDRVIPRCVGIKRDVVEADEHEGGVRKLLNLGHTVGHAIELLSGYEVAHGHAVAAGMAIMARGCAAKGWCSPADSARIDAALRTHGLPTGSLRTPEELCGAAMHDKKRVGDAIDVVVVRGIGQTEVRRLSMGELGELVALGCAAADVVVAEGPDNRLSPVGGGSSNAVVEPGCLGGAIDAIASKSAAHRMLICAALADAPTHIRCATTSKDIEATCACLRALGAKVEHGEGALLVTPVSCTDATSKAVTLDCGESGSTLRFMLPVACALGGAYRFDGGGRLPERPLEPLRKRLVEHGCTVSPAGLWPACAWGRLTGGVFDLPGNVSSQYVTGLLLALPLVAEGGCVRLHGTVESRPYIDLTMSTMRAFGVEVEVGSDFVCGEVDGYECCERVETFTVPAGSRYVSPGEVAVEGDWSNAAFWLCAGALGCNPVTVCGLDLSTDQGDMAVLDILRGFGARVWVDSDTGCATVCGVDEQGAPLALRGTTIDARQVPDLVPVLSVVAACAQGETRVVNAARLCIKESDRLVTTAELLSGLGVEVEVLDDALTIYGCTSQEQGRDRFCGAAVCSHNDHRIAMAAAVAALRADSAVTIEGAEAVAKSYPGFFADLAGLGARVRIEASASTEGRC